MNASYQASLVNRHIRRFTGWLLASVSIASVLSEHHLFVYVRHI